MDLVAAAAAFAQRELTKDALSLVCVSKSESMRNRIPSGGADQLLLLLVIVPSV
jgi:hypothetical protein